MKNKVGKILATLALLLAVSACSDDFLNRTPIDQYVEDNFYDSDAAVSATTAPLYNRAWFDYNSGSIFYIGSQRANECYTPWGEPEWATFQVTALHDGLVQTWKGIYEVVTMANAIIEGLKNKCTNNVSEKAKNAGIAEARLMRAVAYFYMVRIWGPVILFENNQEIVNNPIRPLNLESDVFQFIINDLTFASKYLPETNTAGRATSWTAKALLAKAYLARSGWNGGSRNENDLDLACQYAADVCDNSGLKLLTNYENLFKYRYNNNEESLLAMQWVPLGEWGVCNTLYSSLTISAVSGGVACWGSPDATYEQITQYEPLDTLRLNATFFSNGTYYPYLNIDKGGFTYQDNDGICKTKKGAVGGPDDDNDGKVAAMNSPLNTYILRLADTYITYAEASLGNKETLSSGPGLEYFNKVRERAGLDPKKSITFEDIMQERRCEFGMEYCNWYEMTTWYKWKPDYMLRLFNTQKRGVRATVTYDEKRNRTVTENTSATPDFEIVITKEKIFFPYPEADVIQNPLLKADPQPYNFTE